MKPNKNLYLKYFFILTLGGAMNSYGDVPLSYTGRLVNANGSPVTGPVDLTIDLGYTDPVTPQIKCSQDINNVPLTNGVFHLKLEFTNVQCGGQPISAILANTPVGETSALRVTDRTQNPDKIYSFQAIHAVPYSGVASFAKSIAQMGAITGQVLSWNGTQWAPASAAGVGSVTSVGTGAGLTGGPITSSGSISVATGGITAAMLAQMGAATGNTLKWTGSAWAPSADAGITVETDPNVQGWAKNNILPCNADQALKYDALLNSGAGGLFCSAISLDTDDVAEGSNLYFTDARARTAAVANAINNGTTNIAPAQDAVFDALALKQNLLTSSTGITVGSFQSSPTLTGSSGVEYGARLTPTINQTSTAGYTALFMDVTETGTGSGLHKLLDLRVGGVSKFSIDTNGAVISGTATQGTTANYTSAGGNQLVVGYDTTNKLTTNVDSLGLATFSAAGTAAGFNFTGGNVGIGTPSPQYPLDVNGAAAIGSRLFMGRDGGNFSWIGVRGTDGEPGKLGIGLHSTASGTADQLRFNTSGNERVRIESNGNVGIGTTAPNAKFVVQGSGSTMQLGTPGNTAFDQTTLSFNTLTDGSTILGDPSSRGWQIYARGNAYTGTNEQNDLGFAHWNGTSYIQSLSLDSLTGNVGVGTVAPTSSLHVYHPTDSVLTIESAAGSHSANSKLAVGTTSLWIRNDGSNSYISNMNNFLGQGSSGNGLLTVGGQTGVSLNYGNSGASGTPGIFLNSTGNVGIGTIGPDVPLQVTKTSAGAETLAASFQNNSSAANSAVAIELNSSSAGSGLRGVQIVGLNNGANQTSMAFRTANASLPQEWLRINHVGNIGIGTATPSAKLDIHTSDPMIPMIIASDYDPGTTTTRSSSLKISQRATSAASGVSNGNDLTVDVAQGQGLANLVAGAVLDSSGNYVYTGTRGASRIRLHDGVLNFFTGNTTGTNTAGSAVTWSNANTPSMTIQDEKVGVGTSTPEAKLDIAGATILRGDTAGYGIFMPKFGTPVFGTNYDRFELIMDTAGPLTVIGNRHGGTGVARALGLMTAGAEQMRIDTAGNVGIGLTNPTTKLDVAGTVKATGFEGPIGGSSPLNTSVTNTAASSGYGITNRLATTYSPASAPASGNYVYGLWTPLTTSGSSDLTNAQLLASSSQVNHSTNSNIHSIIGQYASSENSNSGTTNFSTGGQFYSINSGSGVVVEASGLQAASINRSTGSVTHGRGITATSRNESTGSMTDAYGVIAYVENTSSGSITNGYGIYLGAIQATNKWSVYAADSNSPSYFAGKVGVGTSTPTTKLSVVDSSAGAIVNFASSTSDYSGLAIKSNDQNWGIHANGTAPTASFGAAGDFWLNEIGYGPRFLIQKGTGRIGLGTATPAQQLHVHTVSGGVASRVSSGSVVMDSYADSTSSLALIGTSSSHSFGIQTAGSEKVRILSTGFVGIGTTTPGTSVEVGGGVRARGGEPGANGGNNNGYTFGTPGDSDSGMFSTGDGVLQFFTNAGENMRLQGGRMGIVNASPAYTLDVGGDINASGSVRSAGSVLTSDIRLKERLTPIKNSLEKISTLGAFNYFWKDKKKFSSEKQLGLIAQEVQKVYPEAVSKGADGFFAISYSSLIAPIIEAIKELRNKDLEFEKMKKENEIMKAYFCKKDPSAPFCGSR